MKKRRAEPAMQPRTDAHPGVEMDSKGHPVAMAKRLPEDRQKAKRASKSKAK